MSSNIMIMPIYKSDKRDSLESYHFANEMIRKKKETTENFEDYLEDAIKHPEDSPYAL